MADLDLSQHSLNLSSSKMKYSFPKTKRFSESDRPLCDSLYGLPTTLTKRATMLGYGQKTMGLNEKVQSPGVGTYQLESEINPEKNKNHSATFGVSREKMEQGSPLGLLKFTSKIPAPTAYQAKDVHDYRAPSMRSRHPDHDFEKFIKNPGPGTYEHDHMGTNRYYLNSKYKNLTNGKISQVSRLEPISSKKPKVGPSDYQPIDVMNAAGRYSLAKHSSVNSCVIPKSLRQGVVEKSRLQFPGPGQQYALVQAAIRFRVSADFNKDDECLSSAAYRCPQQIAAMLKPKSHLFRVKVMLNKLEAVNNKVASRCHASLRIDNDELVFKATPELKKNVALFNAEVEYENYSLYFDEITGLYENKTALLLLEIETQGTKVKIGEVTINMGAILNEKKYRIVNQFPLAKCYDKTAKVKLSVDFIPLTLTDHSIDRNDRKERTPTARDALSSNPSEKQPLNNPAGNVWKQSNYKSRLAEESNYILQEKIYEYEQKMDNYRLSQTQLQEKLHEQITQKDDHLTEISNELARKNNQVSSMALENEQLKFRIKECSEQALSLRQHNKSLQMTVEGLQQESENLRKEVVGLRMSMDNQGKTKENKEKYFNQEVAKYTQRYLESEQERNRIIFELEGKFKEEMEKKEGNYRAMLANNDKKQADLLLQFKEKLKSTEHFLAERDETIEKLQIDIKRYTELLAQRNKEITEQRKKNQQLRLQNAKISKSESNLASELQTIQFSYHEMEREADKLKEEMNLGRKAADQVRMELQMANQTIEEQRRSITKFSKELQVHQEREYYLTEKYNDELEMKSIHEENIRGQSNYYREQIYKLKNQLRIAEERFQEQGARTSQVSESLHRIQLESNNKNQAIIRLGQQKLVLQNQNRHIREELSEMEEALLMLKEQNLQMNDYLREKKVALDNDKSLEWSYKIEQLQHDISEMVEKFKIEKDLLKDTFRKEENKRKEEIASLQSALKKSRQDYQELKRNLPKKDGYIKEIERTIEEMKQSAKEKSNEVFDTRDRYRILMEERDQLDKIVKQIRENGDSRIKQLEEKHRKEMKSIEKSDSIKANYNRLINYLLEYLTKPYQTVVSFQQLTSNGTDVEIVNMINLSLRRHCEERNKIREQIKRLENQTSFDKYEIRNSEKEIISRYKQKRIVTEQNDSFLKTKYLYGSTDYDGWKQSPNVKNSVSLRDPYQLDNLLDENSKLKREISELKVKIKNIEEDVVRAERNSDSERYAKDSLKHQLEQAQDELQKLNFQIKKKDKILAEYQNELKQMQGEVLSIRNSQAIPTRNIALSRAEIKMKEKEEAAINSRNAIIIKDLESRIESRNRQNEELINEINKLKSEIFYLKEAHATLFNEAKLNENKLKDRNNRLILQQQQYNEAKSNLQQEQENELNKQRKIQQFLEEQVAEREEENKRAQQTIAILEKQIEDLEKRLKILKDESKQTETKLKRDSDNSLIRCKETVSELEATIVGLKSQIDQLNLRNRELNSKNSALSLSLSKKNEELERSSNTLAIKLTELNELQQNYEHFKSQYQTKLSLQQDQIHQLEDQLTNKDYELQQYRFTSQGRLMDLQKRLQEAMTVYAKKT